MNKIFTDEVLKLIDKFNLAVSYTLDYKELFTTEELKCINDELNNMETTVITLLKEGCETK